jgi:plastocyanin
VSREHATTRTSRRTGAALLCAIALAVLAALTGCSGSSAGASSGTASSGTAAPAAGSGSSGGSDAVIMIKDFTFTVPASVSPGATVTVHNMDGLDHTVTADQGAFDSPAPAGNSTFTAPTKPGSYPFHCNIHPEMHGTLVVK